LTPIYFLFFGLVFALTRLHYLVDKPDRE
jgi:hypothetical protein